MATSDKLKDEASRPKNAAIVPLRARIRTRVKSWLRVFTYLTVVALVAAALAVRSAYGDVRRSALQLGSELGHVADGSSQTVHINGETIFLTSTVEDIPLGEVLDKIETLCRKDSAAVIKELEDLPTTVKQKLSNQLDGNAAVGVLREEEERRGVVACLTRDGEPEGMGRIAGRVTDFLESGNLADVGKLRYVFAEATPKGKTRIIAAWTDGPFNLYALIPESGDAPGSDASDVPRPPDAKRLLTADVAGAPYAVRIYDSARSPAEVMAVYDREMAARGWETLVGDPSDTEQRAFGKNGADLMVFTSAEGKATIVSVVETRAK